MVINFFQNLLMPSTFILLFIIIGIFALLRNHKSNWGKAFLLLGVFCYYIFSITPTSDFLLTPLESNYNTLPIHDIENANIAVLLLGGRESNVLRGNEVLRLWHLSNNNMKIIVSGTDPIFSTNGRAQAVRNFFIHRGVNSADIIIEGESRNTKENVINVHKIVGDDMFFLVTSAYHMNRSVKEFERLGVNPITAPTDFKRSMVSKYSINDFIPRGQNLRNSDLATHEHVGFIYYKLVSYLHR